MISVNVIITLGMSIELYKRHAANKHITIQTLKIDMVSKMAAVKSELYSIERNNSHQFNYSKTAWSTQPKYMTPKTR